MRLLYTVSEGGPSSIRCTFRPEHDAAILRTIRTLETINGQPAAEFWKRVDAAASGGVTDAWLTQVAALPAKEQVDAVAAKLKDLNPGFDGKVTPMLDDGGVA